METQFRLKTELSDNAIKPMWGKLPTDNEYDILLTGATRVFEPSGALLAVYIPEAIPPELRESSYEVLHSLRTMRTNNRGLASGSIRLPRNNASSWDEARAVPSAIVGSFDPLGPRTYCRLTAWTGRETEQFSSLNPIFRKIGETFRDYVPDRWQVQEAQARQTKDEWRVEGTPFTTITVNNTYPTGVHVDKGDLNDGFSCLGVLRRGDYSGGRLTFPRFRLAVDLQDGDVILMNAHREHGNTQIQCEHGTLNGNCGTCDAERVSIVCYFRTKMVKCGTLEEEDEKRMAAAQRDNGTIDEAAENAELLAAAVSKGA